MLRKILKAAHPGMAMAALLACSTGPVRPEIPGCRTMECVALGQSQQVWDSFKVTPARVTEDSRCPVEAECIEAGRVLLEARLDIGHETIEVSLDSSRPMRINGGFLSVAEIAPDMSSAWSPIAPEDYRFGFRFVPDIMDQPAARVP